MSFLFGVPIAVASGFCFKNAFYEHAELIKKMNELGNTIVEHKNLDRHNHFNKANNKDNIIVSIQNNTLAGVLDIFEERKRVDIIIGSNAKVYIDKEDYMDRLMSKNINLNLGMNTIVPPNNAGNILFNSRDKVTFSSENAQGMVNELKNKYNFDVNLMINKKYIAEFSSFENKKVYMYGRTISDNKFKAQIMSTSVKKITERVYEDQINNSMFKLGISTFGVICGIIICTIKD